MEPLLSSGQGEAAATTVVGAAASVTELVRESVERVISTRVHSEMRGLGTA